MSITSKARQHQNRRNSSSTVSSPTKQITTIHSSFDSMFHAFQESAMLSAEFVRRSNDCYEQKRRADYDRMVMQGQGQPIPRLPTPSRQSLPDKIRLTMEIQCSDFASLYNGREAWAANDSLSDIMHDTQCMIQFANQCDTERMGIFNQVTITGDMPNIDTAMFRLRQYCPITIVVPLNNIKDEIKQQDTANLVNQWCKGKELGEYSKVQFSILYQPQNALSPANQQIEETKNASPSLVVRASRKDYRLMTAASQAICRLLFDDEAPTFYSHLKIPVSQRKMISGSPDGVLVRSISTATNTMIHYSKPTEPSIRYYLRGSAGDVINAVRSLQDISPVRIEFEAEDEHLMNPAKDVHRELDLFDIERAVIVQLRKSTYEGDFRYEQEGMRHTLTLMTSEENVQSLYKVRRQLLVEDCWKQEGSPKKKSHPAYMDFLKILVMESSMRAYIGEGKVVSVCRCNDKNHDHHPQIHA